MKVVFLGATQGMGRALARLMAERGDELFLLGRRLDTLEGQAADLRIRGASTEVGVAVCDLEHPDGFGAALDAATATLGRFDAVVVTAGLFGTQEALEQDADLRHRVLTVDFTNTIEFCEHARVRLLAMGGGVLCVFSSVARRPRTQTGHPLRRREGRSVVLPGWSGRHIPVSRTPYGRGETGVRPHRHDGGLERTAIRG
jgi:short-subunit dehydrogenase